MWLKRQAKRLSWIETIVKESGSQLPMARHPNGLSCPGFHVGKPMENHRFHYTGIILVNNAS